MLQPACAATFLLASANDNLTSAMTRWSIASSWTPEVGGCSQARATDVQASSTASDEPSSLRVALPAPSATTSTVTPPSSSERTESWQGRPRRM